MKVIRALVVVAALTPGALVALGSGAYASPPQDTFASSKAWACESAAGLPPAHCVNVKSQGDTGVIHVFEPDSRWPQESFSTNPAADLRPCPHDPNADPDGTWWEVGDTGLYVCHHRP